MRLLIIISFIFIQFNSKAQVSGKIIDDKTGLTLPGVNVYIPATQQGVATNEKGEFLSGGYGYARNDTARRQYFVNGCYCRTTWC